MKAIILFFSLAILPFIAFTQPGKCLEAFKTGKFVYDIKLEDKVEIIRTSTTQTETVNDGESIISGPITWINDSTYVLKVKKIKNLPGCLSKGDSFVTTVVKCEGNKFFLEYESESCGKGTCVLIKVGE